MFSFKDYCGIWDLLVVLLKFKEVRKILKSACNDFLCCKLLNIRNETVTDHVTYKEPETSASLKKKKHKYKKKILVSLQILIKIFD